ncbi:SecY-interacting protein [Ferrimonas pelagia]|uniref:SecY-interacting protein n=1 Tax=Ferrimonas pelagia TaxID=1177826 RepID=A0ABP9EH20_9GAMM
MSASSLSQFIERHHQAWLKGLGHAPVSDKERDGPALLQRDSEGLAQWQAQPQSPQARFGNIAEAMELTLHPDLARFYGEFYAGPLQFDSAFGAGELLQVWDQTDLDYLQENLIGHLLMKQQLKHLPTLFIGLLNDSDAMLVLDNADGSVWLEIPGQRPHQRIADGLDDLLQQLAPRVELPVVVAPQSAQQLGLLARLKRMWQHIKPGRRG